MINLNTIFKPILDQGDTLCWKFTTKDYECWIWMGMYSTPQGKEIKPNDAAALSFRILTTHTGELKDVRLSDKYKMLALFGYDLSAYTYATYGGQPNQGANVPIEIVKDIVEKVIRFDNPFPDDAGDGEQ